MQVEGHLWSQGNVIIFTVAVYDEKSKVKGYALCTEHEGKEKFAMGTFLDHLYENCIPDNPGIEEVLWTDGPSSEFNVNEK